MYRLGGLTGIIGHIVPAGIGGKSRNRRPGALCASALALVLLALGALPTQARDVADCRDHPLLTRMPDFHIDDCEVREFDAYEFLDSGGTKIRVEGRKTYIDYGLERGAETPSELQIVRNHTGAIRHVGGTVLWEDRHNAHLRVTRDGQQTWVHVRVYNQATAYSLFIVEEEPMTQEVEADAETMARHLADTGKVVLYGIFFDFDKAVIRPESEPTLQEIARLLEEKQELRLHVVGHTDSTGALDYNLDLSRRRAAAVVEVLISKYGISSERLRPAGVGPLAPAAANATEEGRARNRRVELVEQ